MEKVHKLIFSFWIQVIEMQAWNELCRDHCILVVCKGTNNLLFLWAWRGFYDIFDKAKKLNTKILVDYFIENHVKEWRNVLEFE